MEKLPIEERVDNLEEKVENIEAGFPSQDYSGHARYHQAVIEEIQSRMKLRQAVIEQVVKGSVWAGLLFLCTAVFTYFKEHVLVILPFVK
jgi:hypothetical protein